MKLIIEIEIDVNGWEDYYFENETSLKELEKEIKNDLVKAIGVHRTDLEITNFELSD